MPNPASADSGLFDTVVKLVNLGFAGVGVVVFLLLFVMLLRGQPVDAGTQRLRNRFLTWGVSFAVFCGILSLLAPLVQRWATAGATAPVKMTLTFSPSFQSRKLSPPQIMLPDGSAARPDTQFALNGGMVKVSVDEALEQVTQLQKTAMELVASAQQARSQRDDALEIAAKQSPAATVPEIKAVAESSGKTAALEADVSQAIARGDFARAAQASAQIKGQTLRSGAMVERMSARVGGN